MEYSSSSVKAEEIRALEEYVGVRVFIESNLGKARIRIQVDIGVGDAIIPPPSEIEYPTLLDLPNPLLSAYRQETVIAEKLHAIVHHGLNNTRMKDYFDLDFLARTFAFDGRTLASAIRATFDRRGTAIPKDIPVGLSSEFYDSSLKQTQWKAFYRKVVEDTDPPSLPHVVAQLCNFLLPVLTAALNESFVVGQWGPGGPWSKANAQ